jgi:hypothetical protein
MPGRTFGTISDKFAVTQRGARGFRVPAKGWKRHPAPEAPMPGAYPMLTGD